MSNPTGHQQSLISEQAIVGCVLGTAVGDALGLPYEGLSRDRAARMLGSPDHYRLFFRRGMVSDDTEHACMIAQSLIASRGEVKQFQRTLAWRLRVWLLGIPAGIGMATLRAVLRLWFGVSPSRSGVFSAGNGPTMRAPLLGVVLSSTDDLRDYVRASTRITHTDPKAELGAFAVALAAQMASRGDQISPASYLRELKSCVGGDASEFIDLMAGAIAAAERGDTTQQYAASLGLKRGVSGYVYHTVPVCIHAWLGNQRDFRSAVMTVIQCGGDTDSTAAIVGGIVGASVGREGIPQRWLDSLFEWPRSVVWMERLGRQLTEVMNSDSSARPMRLPTLAVLARNVFFLAIVLLHGFRRLAPPY